jgi:signal transduction histidine kinase
MGLARELADERSSILGAERLELASLVADQAGEVAHIVDDLLVASRSETDALTILPDTVALDLVVTDVVVELGVDVTIAPTPAPAHADRHRVRHIVRNMVSNAVKYGGCNVRIETSISDREAFIDVVDDGEGVAPEQVEEIFDPFVRAHSARSTPDTFGIGLAVARRLARLIGGDVAYRRIDEIRFRLRLPIARDEAALIREAEVAQ